MSDAYRTRLGRYAAFAVFHALIGIAAIAGAFGSQGGIVILVVSAPLLPAWGAFQGAVAVDPGLDETDRRRWRLGLWFFPWAMTAYWFRRVR